AAGSQSPRREKASARPAPSASITLARVRLSPAKPSHIRATADSKPCATRSGIVWPRTQMMPRSPSAWLSTVSAATTPSRPLAISGSLHAEPYDRGAQLRNAGTAAGRGRKHLRVSRRMLGEHALHRGKACVELGGGDLVGLGQHDLVVHCGLVES